MASYMTSTMASYMTSNMSISKLHYSEADHAHYKQAVLATVWLKQIKRKASQQVSSPEATIALKDDYEA